MVAGDEEAQQFFQQAIELGITFWTPPMSMASAARRRSSVGRHFEQDQ
jgi:hypothetical protein